MPYNPHTSEGRARHARPHRRGSIDDLFDEIPEGLRIEWLAGMPEDSLKWISARLDVGACGARTARRSISSAPAPTSTTSRAVWAITTRGEIYSAYTPYQAEASQGTLQLIYEYQTMIAGLTGHGRVECVAVRRRLGVRGLAHGDPRASQVEAPRILVPTTVQSNYWRRVAEATTGARACGSRVPCPKGFLDRVALAKYAGEDVTAIVIQQPNFFGAARRRRCAHRLGARQRRARHRGGESRALAILKPPGEWGDEGRRHRLWRCQPLGVPLSSGGPYAGSSPPDGTRAPMPGRIAGRTVDPEGKPGFALTLQAREQHIRRGKATSNICTNQGLLVTAATIDLALSGPEGLARVASASLGARGAGRRAHARQGREARSSRPALP